MTALVPTREDVLRPPGRGRRPALPVSVAISVVALAGAGALSLLVGARAVPVSAVWDTSHPLHAVVEARLDRTLLALAVGAALGLAGALMQGLTRNPLADPGILGVNAGATFAMVVGMTAFGASAMGQFLPLAFVGAAVAAAAVHGIASMGRDGATPMKLAITGAALSAGLASWTTGLLLADRKTMESFRFWQVGTVAGRGTDVLVAGLPFLVVGALLALAGARLLNTLALGDDLARGLGRHTTRDRLVIALAIVLLAGTATALAGPIAFVGLVVPHVVRALVGPDHRRLLPFSMLGGAVLVVVADTVGRVVLPPSEVQVGIMAAVVGVPVFIALIRRTGRAL
ncbi:iron ABC transporter permease [Nocardioides sp. zg-1228]|uniref:FecCD family ABC transporter permease n=1 Tax=Nocardioides sp. zg-1228 TaxID=2763008 RepID=UPI001642B238|nr:iron ABC transporter permease [Nocardioides sp. zg-1228]MBC2931850.1 iron ABC transporter permease [Nocardioides sp. zg-1228]QSF57417.1 iron ABC transporter permease [Nocardioides sp. zg-1228]